MASEVTVSEQEAAWQAGEQAGEALGPEMGVLARLDPADFGTSVLAAFTRAAGRPAEAGRAWLRYGSALAAAGPVAVARWAGAGTPPPVPADEKDRRFAGPAAGGGPAGRRARRPADGPEGAAGGGFRVRRAGPGQLPAHQPGRGEEG